MDFAEDPEELSPEARLQELASILAAGYLRMKRGAAELAFEPSAPSPFTENPLDCSGGPGPSCVEGLTRGDAAPLEVCLPRNPFRLDRGVGVGLLAVAPGG
jgi:hypothetical protein